MREKKIKAVLFDLGETLLNFGRMNIARLFYRGAKATHEFLKKQDQPTVNFHFYYFLNLVSLYVRQFFSDLRCRDFDSLAVFKEIGQRDGVKLSSEQWQQFAWLWYEPLSKRAQIEPNISETLTTLGNMGLKLGIVSNTFVNRSSIDKHLAEVNILEFFPVRLYSYEFDFRKPDLRLFEIATNKINTKFENILFVGDRIDNDIKPALKSGMHAVLKEAYTNKGKRIPKGARKITHLAELPQLIEQINCQS